MSLFISLQCNNKLKLSIKSEFVDLKIDNITFAIE